jgi:hypothetical protein
MHQIELNLVLKKALYSVYSRMLLNNKINTKVNIGRSSNVIIPWCQSIIFFITVEAGSWNSSCYLLVMLSTVSKLNKLNIYIIILD